jgi:hypothetical protein
MKRTIFVVSFLILVILLSACGSKTTTTTTTSNTATDVTEITPETKLLLGTLKLDGTDQAVTSEQAATLLPLWKMYKSLTTSDTAAQAEIDAVFKQIQSGMTSDQLTAIDEMDIKSGDMANIMQEFGLAMAPGANASGPTPDLSQVPQDFQGGQPSDNGGTGRTVNGPSGGQPPAGFSGDMPQGDGSSGMIPGSGTNGSSATPQAGQTGRNGGNSMFTSRILNALIDYLNKLIQP